tara:strand:- start:613 stop:954 length:342 start_codon:yes stop_codon:yes gene_type:complete
MAESDEGSVEMSIKQHYKIVTCADGFSMSVQASQTHYCDPRDDVGPYTHVEVGVPSTYDFYLREYAADPSRPTGTVYGYVPADTIVMCIDAHGGMVGGELPPLIKTELEDDEQ